MEPIAPALTKADLAALRTASDVVFSTYDGKSLIRCIVRVGDYDHKSFHLTEGWKLGSLDQSVEYTISVSGRFEEYQEPKGRDNAFAMINASQFNEVWTGIKLHLRVGDSLALNWIADNNSLTITEANLHSDELELWVRRPRADGHITPFAFHVTHSICHENTARMVRFGAYNQAPVAVQS